jgi:D-beta-D-heptose 7-phosphate kinase/D-beta-D-heptose 1-phosphate adenosyltransferase
MKRIWVNGTFDILHIGHVRLLNFAKSLGTVRVGLDTDKRVREKKGMARPYNSLSDRMEFISSINGVDSVVFFDDDMELVNRIKEWEPNIMVIGDDYIGKEIIGSEYIDNIIFFNKIKGKSTTSILNYENNSNR